jgi:hypothetical protein
MSISINDTENSEQLIRVGVAKPPEVLVSEAEVEDRRAVIEQILRIE